jgi:Lysylphosphatidylglycerol synthase TM region
MLLDPGDGDVAASDLQIRLDTAQLLAELALVAGPDRAAGLAVEKMSADDLVAVVSLLQPVALSRPTRKALRRRRDVLPALRKRLLAAVPGGEVTPVRLERIRPRIVLTLVAAVAAVYLLAGELGRASLGSVLHKADWRWGIAGLALSAATYVGATESLRGFVPGRLSFRLTLLVQLASSFVTLVTPAAVGGATLNIRYLQRQKIPAAAAAASVGVAQVVAFVLHVLLILVFAAIAGSSATEPVHPPRWTWFVLAGLVLIALVVLAIPAGRRVLRARLSPMLGQVLPQLLEVAQHPAKLAQGHRRNAAAEPVLHLLPDRLRGGVQPAGADRENRRGVPDRQRHRLDHPHPRRHRRGGSGADRRAHGRRRPRRGRGQRGAVFPAGDILAADPIRLGGPEVPGARAGRVSSADPEVARNDEASRWKLVPEASLERLSDLSATWSPRGDLSVGIPGDGRWRQCQARSPGAMLGLLRLAGGGAAPGLSTRGCPDQGRLSWLIKTSRLCMPLHSAASRMRRRLWTPSSSCTSTGR